MDLSLRQIERLVYIYRSAPGGVHHPHRRPPAQADGKYRSALFGLFLPPVGVIGALRLARPSSIWARHRYRGKRLERATRRAADFDRRWVPLLIDWEDFVGGKPSKPNPPASSDVHH